MPATATPAIAAPSRNGEFYGQINTIKQSSPGSPQQSEKVAPISQETGS